MIRTALIRATVVGVLVASGCAAAETRPLRERLAARAGERIAAAAPPAAPLEAGARITAPGRYEIRLQHDGRERMALVHVPAMWRPSEAAPLVVALHGAGGGAVYQADDARYGLIGKSEQVGFVAVFPNGVSRLRSGMLATWNAGRCCGRARDENVDDVGFLRALVADVQSRVRIDGARVYAIGMSNGGMMAYRLACEAADVFRGIMAVAGTDNTELCEPARPVAILHVHARNDDRVLYEGGAGQVFRDRARVTDFRSVAATIDKWVRLNGASPTPERVLSVDGAHCDLHAARSGGAPVQLCVTESGGHSWPGGSKRRGEAPSNAIRANDVMWEFFASL